METAHVLEIERLNRLYSALSHINQAIVRMHTRDELLRRVCEVLVQHGGFRMAWIGWHEPATHRLLPVAQAGDESDYLKSIVVYADDRPEGRGPSGKAFRENRPYICDEVQQDPATLPWRGELGRRGLIASAALPIRANGSVVGTLSVYADRPGAFRDKELALLVEAADDISFALDNLSRDEDRKRAEEQAASEQRLTNGLIEAMPGIFYLYDGEGRFLRWNQNFEKVSGYSGAEIARMHPLDFFGDDEKALLTARIAEVFEKGEATVEASFLAKDGSRIPYFFTGKRIELEGALRLVGVGVDIVELRRAEEAVRNSEQRFRTTLDSMLEGCQLIGFDWRYLYLNPAAAIHNRRPNAELLGQRMPDMWPGIEHSTVFAMLRRCMDERVAAHDEVDFGFADGSTAWFDVRVQPAPEGIFVVSIDISERKAAERALRELNESLERKVRDRTIDLDRARVRAEAADRIKSAFLATMSHELRTPLNSILGFTGLILKGMAGPLVPEQQKQLGMVQGSARHLLDLINDVLDISKIEAGQLEVRWGAFDLRASVERVSGSVMPLAQKKGLTVEVQMPQALGVMVSDQRRVEQVLLNLLNNGIKFTERGGVTVSVEVLTEGDGSDTFGKRPLVRFRVADTGCGIRAEDLSKLFQPFRQLDSGVQRQHEGTGLGLAICGRLTNMLGGTIHAASVHGQGSTFTVVLPIEPQEIR
jgi:PAS domain S-box-containing protein